MILLIVNVSLAFSGSNFAAERLEDAVRKYISSNVELSHEIDLLTVLTDKAFEMSEVTATISHRGELRGMCDVIIEFRNKERLLDRIKVNTRIRLYAEIPVAATNLTKSKVISEEDIAYKVTEVTDIQLNQIPQKNEIIGKTVLESIYKQQAVLLTNITSDLVLSRGEKVEILVNAGAVQVRAYGTAMNDARVGEMIRVKRDGSTKKIIYGRVSPSGAVELYTNNSLYGGVE